MSNSPFTSDVNPYAAQPHAGYAPRPMAEQMPGLCKTMFIIDLVFDVLRIPMLIFGLIGWLSVDFSQEAIGPTVMFEVLTGAAILLSGLPANIGLLMKQRWAPLLGWLSVTATVGSLGVAVWQTSLMLGGVTDAAQRTGMLGGAGVMLVIRVLLLGLYSVALLKFSSWLANQNDRA